MKHTTLLILVCACLAMLLVLTVLLFTTGKVSFKIGQPVPEGGKVSPFDERGQLLPTRDLDSTEWIAQRNELGRICESALAELVRDNLDSAFRILRKHCALSEQEFVGLQEKTASQLNMVRPRFGKMLTYEPLDSKAAGDSLIRLRYIVKCEKHIFAWYFIFYKPKDRWTLNAFGWDSEVHPLFE